jgi:tyrosine-specific transport protein
MIGSFIPLVAYVIWQWLILGIVPTYGPHGLAEALEKGHNAVKPLDHFISNPAVPAIGEFFAFFALTTSFFGVTLGLLDFLSDGLNIVKNEKGKIFLCLMIFIPPLIVAAIHPGIFLEALSYAGGFGCAILLGLLPIMMVWRGRYYLGFKSEPQLPGGRIVLSLLALFVFFELACEITHLFRG